MDDGEGVDEGDGPTVGEGDGWTGVGVAATGGGATEEGVGLGVVTGVKPGGEEGWEPTGAAVAGVGEPGVAAGVPAGVTAVPGLAGEAVAVPVAEAPGTGVCEGIGCVMPKPWDGEGDGPAAPGLEPAGGLPDGPWLPDPASPDDGLRLATMLRASMTASEATAAGEEPAA
ncbi:MAG: hypothetical protein AB7T37_08255 [Dehalococcoidia bacterium]